MSVFLNNISCDFSVWHRFRWETNGSLEELRPLIGKGSTAYVVLSVH